MIPSISVPIAQSAAPAPALNQAAVVPVPSQVTSNLVFQAVGANSSAVALFNNVRGSSTEAISPRSSEAIANAFKKETEGPERSSVFPRYGFSSSFLAQAIGQEDPANDNRIFADFTFPPEETATEEQPQPPRNDAPLMPNYVETTALHLASLQRVSIKAYNSTVSRNIVNLNVLDIASINRVA